MRSLLFALALAACGAPAKPVETPPPSPPPAPITTVAADQAPDVAVPLAGGANALWWDAASATLYLSDNNADALLQWTDAGGLKTVGTFPTTASGVSLGGIVRRPDGTTLITSFGFGKSGTLFTMGADKAGNALNGLDPVRRRVGLAQDAKGALYTAYFVGGRSEKPIGGVASVAIDGKTAAETEVAGSSTQAGFQKLVGLVATPSALYVADQSQQTIFKIAVPGYQVSPLASVPKVDLLVQLPNGDLLTGGAGALSRVTPAGAVTTLPGAPLEQIRGIAFDPAGKRLFLIDHSATPGRPDRLIIRGFAG